MLTSLLLQIVIGRILTGLFLVLLTCQISQAGVDPGTRGVEIILKEPDVILRSLYDKSRAIVNCTQSSRSENHLSITSASATPREMSRVLRSQGLRLGA